MAAIDEFIDGLIEIEPEIPQTFIWPAPPKDGTEYTCFASGFSKAGKLEQSGYGIDEGGTIVVRISLFGDGGYPARGQEIQFKEITYRIDSITTAQGGAFFRIVCVNASRGA